MTVTAFTIAPDFGMLLFIPLIIGIYILFFLAIRGLVLWYFKINEVTWYHEEHIRLMEEQNLLIEQQTEILKEFKTQMGNNTIDPNK